MPDCDGDLLSDKLELPLLVCECPEKLPCLVLLVSLFGKAYRFHSRFGTGICCVSMATVLSLSSHLAALGRVFGRKKSFSLVSLVVRRGSREHSTSTNASFSFYPCTFQHQHRSSSSLTPVTFHVFCLHGRPASPLSTIPSIPLHERHMLTSPSVRGETQRDGILSSKRSLGSGRRSFFSLLSRSRSAPSI